MANLPGKAWTALVGTATIVGGVFAVLTYCSPPTSGTPSSTGSPTVQTPTTTPATAVPAPESPMTSPSPAIAAGACLASGTPVPCDFAHDAEVVATSGACDVATFVRFAGGDPAREILRTTLTVRQGVAGSPSACVVSLPVQLRASTKGSLGGRDGDVLRRCFDDRTRAETDCATPHTREAVAVRPAGSTAALDCQASAAAYLDAPAAQVLTDLRLVTSTSDRGTTCWVATRGTNLLTSSVRAIGHRTLPLVAGG